MNETDDDLVYLAGGENCEKNNHIINKLLSSALLKSAGIYTISNVINASIPFFLMPVMTRYLTPEDYGITAMFGVLLSLVAPFVGVSTIGAIVRQYYEKQVDMPQYITNCLVILLISASLIAIVFFLFAESISKFSAFPSNWLWAVLVVSVGSFLCQVILSIWRVKVKPKLFGVYQISLTAVNMALSVWFVVGLGHAWEGRITSQILAVTGFALLALYILYRNGWLKFSFNKSYIQHAIKFGVPLIPHTLGAVINTMVGRFMVANLIGLPTAGLYVVGHQIGYIIGILEDSFNKAYAPWLFAKLKENKFEDKKNIVKLTYAYFFVILLLSIFLSLVAPWFLSFFVGEKFTGSYIFVIWIALGYAFSGMYKMVTNYIFYVQKTYILAWITFLCAIVNTVLCYYLIRLNGAVGAAQAMTITQAIFFITTWILSAREYKMPWLLNYSRKK